MMKKIAAMVLQVQWHFPCTSLRRTSHGFKKLRLEI